MLPVWMMPPNHDSIDIYRLLISSATVYKAFFIQQQSNPSIPDLLSYLSINYKIVLSILNCLIQLAIHPYKPVKYILCDAIKDTLFLESS